jgi:hypothetical protein
MDMLPIVKRKAVQRAFKREFLTGKGIDVDTIAPQFDGKFMSAFVFSGSEASLSLETMTHRGEHVGTHSNRAMLRQTSLRCRGRN